MDAPLHPAHVSLSAKRDAREMAEEEEEDDLEDEVAAEGAAVAPRRKAAKKKEDPITEYATAHCDC